MLNEQRKRYLYIVVLFAILINFFFINEFTQGIHKEDWKEVASDIAKFNNEKGDNVYSEQAFYLNYYLKKSHHKTAQSYKVNQDEESFCLLRTPYDSQGQISSSYSLIRAIDYGNEFVLEYYELEIE